jgi:hypothetical protein
MAVKLKYSGPTQVVPSWDEGAAGAAIRTPRAGLGEPKSWSRATVAVANKTARVIWTVLRTGEPYRAVA